MPPKTTATFFTAPTILKVREDVACIALKNGGVDDLHWRTLTFSLFSNEHQIGAMFLAACSLAMKRSGKGCIAKRRA
jgi:hypothetical protein